jgi:hypothetical protein
LFHGMAPRHQVNVARHRTFDPRKRDPYAISKRSAPNYTVTSDTAPCPIRTRILTLTIRLHLVPKFQKHWRYTMFRGSVKSTGYPLHSPVSPSLPLPCVIVPIRFQLDSTICGTSFRDPGIAATTNPFATVLIASRPGGFCCRKCDTR